MSEPDILSDISVESPDIPQGQPEMPDAASRVVNTDELHFEVMKRDQLIREKDQALQERSDEHDLRKKYIRATFVFVCGVTFVSLFLTTAAGMGWIALSDTVLVTLLTTTIANVLGCLFIAFHWLFPKR